MTGATQSEPDRQPAKLSEHNPRSVARNFREMHQRSAVKNISSCELELSNSSNPENEPAKTQKRPASNPKKRAKIQSRSLDNVKILSKKLDKLDDVSQQQLRKELEEARKRVEFLESQLADRSKDEKADPKLSFKIRTKNSTNWEEVDVIRMDPVSEENSERLYIRLENHNNMELPVRISLLYQIEQPRLFSVCCVSGKVDPFTQTVCSQINPRTHFEFYLKFDAKKLIDLGVKDESFDISLKLVVHLAVGGIDGPLLAKKVIEGRVCAARLESIDTPSPLIIPNGECRIIAFKNSGCAPLRLLPWIVERVDDSRTPVTDFTLSKCHMRLDPDEIGVISISFKKDWSSNSGRHVFLRVEAGGKKDYYEIIGFNNVSCTSNVESVKPPARIASLFWKVYESDLTVKPLAVNLTPPLMHTDTVTLSNFSNRERFFEAFFANGERGLDISPVNGIIVSGGDVSLKISCSKATRKYEKIATLKVIIENSKFDVSIRILPT